MSYKAPTLRTSTAPPAVCLSSMYVGKTRRPVAPRYGPVRRKKESPANCEGGTPSWSTMACQFTLSFPPRKHSREVKSFERDTHFLNGTSLAAARGAKIFVKPVGSMAG